jgi:hypothetical protein
MKPNRSLVVNRLKAKIMRLLLVITFSLLTIILPSTLKAQDVAEADTVDMGILLLREKSANIMLHTLGYGLGFRFGTNKTFYKNRMFEFDLLEMRSPTQARSWNTNLPNTRSYFYGKLNNLYIIRAGVGQQHLMNRKPYWGGVEVRAFYYGGVDLGLAKPNYLYIAYWTADTINPGLITLDRTELERYDPERHFPDIGTNSTTLSNIYGRGPMLSGFNKIKFYPGIYLKGGFNFEFSGANDRIKAVEIGATADIFPNPVPIMAFKKANYFFITGYLSFHLGKRYN